MPQKQENEKNLKRYRDTIDEIDEQIVKLLEKRFEAAHHIVHEKMKTNSAIFRPSREQAIFNKLTKLHSGTIDHVYLQNIYREIMSATIRMEKLLKISYLGPPGTYTHQAALKKFGHSLELIPQKSIGSVFRSASMKEVQYGIVPLENSIEGMVNSTLDFLLEYDLQIYSEVALPIHHNLIGTAKSLDDIQEIYTHGQALGQCRRWLSLHLPQVAILETASTAQAVELVSQKESIYCAAIGSEAAAHLYHLPILQNSIEDVTQNFTRFIVIGKEKESIASQRDRSSLIFKVSHQAGALFDALSLFNEANINLTSLVSRPDRTDFGKFTFYIDFEGHQSQAHIAKLLQDLSHKTIFMRLLGSYPFDETI